MSARRDLGRDMGALLAQVRVLPAPVLRTVFRYAVSTEDGQLLTQVVARMDAPADLVEQFATVDVHAARAAFAARPALPGDRPSAALGDIELPVLCTALESVERDPSPALVAAALAALERGLDLHDRLVGQIATGVPAQYFSPAAARSTLALLPQGAGVAGEHLGSLVARLGRVEATTLIGQGPCGHVLAELARFDVPVDELLATCKRRVRQNPFEWVSAHQMVLRLAVSAQSSPEGIGASELHQMFYGPGPWTFTEIVDRVKVMLDALPGPRQVEAWDDSPVVDGDGRLGTSARWWVAAASCDRPDVVSTVAQQILDEAPWPTGQRQEVLSTLLVNPALPLAARRAVMDRLAGAGQRNPGRELLLTADPAVVFPADEHVRSAWCQLLPDVVLTVHGWGVFGGRERASDVLAVVAQQHARGWIPDVDVDELLRVLVAREDPDWLMSVLPATLAGRMPCVGLAARGLSAALAQAGADADSWTVFASLYPTFTGTLGQLVGTCSSVAGR